MKRVSKYAMGFVALLFVIVPSVAIAGLIQVSQESEAGVGDFDSNVLGFIDPFVSALSAQQYYSYHTNYIASFDDGAQDVTLTSNTSHFFFVDGADGLSAFVVHDKPLDETGGEAYMRLAVEGDSVDWLARDDPHLDTFGSDSLGFYSMLEWSDCCTDGFVLGALENDWSLTAWFYYRNWSDFAGWTALGDDGEIALSGDYDRRVRFTYVSDVSEPGTLALLGIGLFVMGLWIMRRD